LNYNNPEARKVATGKGPKVSVLNVMGTDDPLIKYEGGSSPVFGGVEEFSLMNAEESMEVWAEHNGCSTTAVRSTIHGVEIDQGDGTAEFYEYPCDDDTIVEHYAIIGGQHNAGGAKFDGISFREGIAFDFIRRLEKDATPTGAPGPTDSPTPADPSSDKCEDDASWTFTNKRGKTKDCAWVGKKSTNMRCRKTGLSNGEETKAKDACIATCGTCPEPAPTDAPTPQEGDVSCEDDDGWVGKNNNKHTCSFLAGKAEGWRRNACNNWLNVDGVVAKDACKDTCDSCP